MCGGGAAEANTSPVLLKRLCGGPYGVLFISSCVWNLVLVSMEVVGRVVMWDAWRSWAGSRERPPSPGSLPSSQDRSSELTSARLGVRLESSESEAASVTLTSPPWRWGSRDAPKSKVQVWLRCSAMPWKLEVCLDTGPRSLAEHLTSSFNSETMALLKQMSNVRKRAGSSQTHTHAHAHPQPDLTDFFFCLWTLWDGLHQLGALSSAVVRQFV